MAMPGRREIHVTESRRDGTQGLFQPGWQPRRGVSSAKAHSRRFYFLSRHCRAGLSYFVPSALVVFPMVRCYLPADHEVL